MPELPEVETVRRGLHGLIVGKRVKDVSYDWPKGFPNAQTDIDEFLIGSHVIDVRRRAKVLLIDLDTMYTLVVHLKMTGQMVYVEQHGLSTPHKKDDSEIRFGAGHPNESLVGTLPDKSTRVIFTFNGGANLFFNDQRKFGWIRLMPTIEVPNIDFMRKVGPEPLSDDFLPQHFIERIRRRKNTNIKAVLLDQSVIAGVGNIYADESLWGAKLHPATLVKDITDTRLKVLYKELRDVMTLAIEKGGSTDKNYVNAEGGRGSYLQFARVFRREGKACPRCGTIIHKSRVAGRGTHTCPQCQKLTKK